MKKKIVIALILVLCSVFVLSACQKDAENYTVTLSVRGKVYDTVTTDGQSAPTLPTPTVKGYEFQGWYLDTEFKNSYKTVTSVTADITVYAKLIPDYSVDLTPSDFLTFPVTVLPDSAKITVDRVNNKYLGHPDLVLTDDGKLITMYPLGHGKGQIAAKISEDMGLTWSERVAGLPASFANSQETPTLYNLKFTDGRTKLVLISGCPYWPGIPADGFNFSYSDDNGETWSEFQKFHSPADTIVAMSSLTQLKENGQFVDKWMGTYHDHSFVNYKTILTFDADGNAQWSEPVALMPENREQENRSGLCEVEIIRNPEDDALILVGRAESRATRSMISVSRDEGATWSPLRELPYELSGDRHKAEIDPTTGKVLISYRQIIPDDRYPAPLFKKILCDGWFAWIGDFEDLLSYADDDPTNDTSGDYLVLLGATDGDSGYSGTVCVDGSFTLISYGKFSEDAYNPYIMAVKFTLADIAALPSGSLAD